MLCSSLEICTRQDSFCISNSIHLFCPCLLPYREILQDVITIEVVCMQEVAERLEFLFVGRLRLLSFSFGSFCLRYLSFFLLDKITVRFDTRGGVFRKCSIQIL